MPMTRGRATVVRRSFSNENMQPVDTSDFHREERQQQHHDNNDHKNSKLDNSVRKSKQRHGTVVVVGEKSFIGRIVCPFCLAFQAIVFVALVWNTNVKRIRAAVGGVGLQRSEQGGDMSIIPQGQSNNKNNNTASLFDEFLHCTLPTPPRPRKEWTTKPILVPGYPSYFHESRGTANGDIIEPLIRHLTGIEQGSRNFHAASKGGLKNRVLKRCHTPQSETVTCSQVHPVVDINPEKHQKLFDSHVILALQNFARALPMGASIKANRYSNTVGQAPVEEWRKTRDKYLQEAFDSWKSVITTWKSYDYYKISMYLPYEHLMDAVKGPLIIQRLAKQLQSSGFDTVNGQTDSDQAGMQCIWKRSIQDVIKFEDAYIKYAPAYTAKQRDYLLQQMQQFIEEIRTKDSNDVELIQILQEYHDEIRDVIPIEDDDVASRAAS